MGDYLKFNASHKASLYIASGKPQIVWNESALAEFIVQNNLGIAVSSLEEIPQRLKSITDAKYTEILQNIKKFQQLVRNGGMLEVALNSPPE
jgi:flagellar motor component MotA